MHDRGSATRLALGAAAGFAGTLALQLLRTASQKAIPATMPPIRTDPGEFMVEKVEQTVLPRAQVPTLVETAAAKSLAVGYGLTAGVLYAALRPNAGPVPCDGLTLGLATWAAGYLGWLPALGLMPPLREQGVAQTLGPAIRHTIFGVVTVAAYRRLLNLIR